MDVINHVMRINMSHGCVTIVSDFDVKKFIGNILLEILFYVLDREKKIQFDETTILVLEIGKSLTRPNLVYTVVDGQNKLNTVGPKN